ncbi:MAG TPA: T9SS type A sorting domain-containing protein [Bacteroidia bacterium]|nr:T9SS type A sorting domain-containing protein [Bacteroidia bacterium]
MKIIFNFLALIILSGNVTAQWTTDANNDTPTYLAPLSSNGMGNSFTSDVDEQGNIFIGITISQFGGDIALQKVDSNGYQQWGTSGVVITSTTFNAQSSPFIIADDIGGCYVAYDDNDFFNGAFIQHFDAQGIPQIPGKGKLILQNAYQTFGDISMLKQDNFLYISLTAEKLSDKQVYLQKMDFNLNYVWDSTGVNLSLPGVDELQSKIISDGVGGMVVLYNRYYSLFNYQVRAQRVDSAGNILWGPVGKFLNPANLLYSPSMKITADTNYHFYVVWDAGANTNSDIYAQKLDTAGNFLWGVTELHVCDTVRVQNFPDVVADNNGGAYFVWSDRRSSIPIDYCFAQYINSAGQKLWTKQGLAIDTLPYYNAIYPKLYYDSFGLNVFWTGTSSGNRIYKQVLDSNGIQKCTAYGVPVTGLDHFSFDSDNIIPLANGDAVVACIDAFNFLYLKYVPSGCSFTSVSVSESNFEHDFIIAPNPAVSNTLLIFDIKKQTEVTITIYDIAGKRMMHSNLKADLGRNNIPLNLATWPKGFYTVEVMYGQKRQQKKLIVQ